MIDMDWLENAIKIYKESGVFEQSSNSKVLISSNNDLPDDFNGIKSVAFMSDLKDDCIEELILDVINKANDLESLSVFSKEISWSFISSLELSHLTELTFSLKGDITHEKVYAPKLKKLCLFGNSNLTPLELMLKTYSHFNFSGMNALNSLELRHFQLIDPIDFAELSSLKKLIITDSEITNLDWLKDASYQLESLYIKGPVENCKGVVYQPTLKELRLNDNHIQDVSPIIQLKQLNILDLSYREDLDDSILRQQDIETLVITRYDHDIMWIRKIVLDLTRDAVNNYRGIEKKIKKEDSTRLSRIILERKLNRPFEEIMKEFIQLEFNRRLRIIGEKRVNTLCISQDEYKRTFIDEAIDYYPFLAINNANQSNN